MKHKFSKYSTNEKVPLALNKVEVKSAKMIDNGQNTVNVTNSDSRSEAKASLTSTFSDDYFVSKEI